MAEIIRCGWANHSELEQRYHDEVWGVPEHDEQELFARLILEGMQAGLSWSLILKKKDAFYEAFDNFDPSVIVSYDEAKIEGLMGNAGIIRNRLKITSAITNAEAYFRVAEKYGSLDRFLWNYVDFEPIVNTWSSMDDIPAHTELSDRLSKDLKKEGFKFVGTTIVYAFMQSIGMVNDHLISCMCHPLNSSRKTGHDHSENF